MPPNPYGSATELIAYANLAYTLRNACYLCLCRYTTNDHNVVQQLEALRKTVPDYQQYVFWDAVHRLEDVDSVFSKLSLRTWGWFFQPSFVDTSDICAKVFCVVVGIVHLDEPTPACPRCGGRTRFQEDCSTLFGWRYRCDASKRLKRAPCLRCRGSVMPTRNTWFDDSRSLGSGLFLTYLWTCRIRVCQAARHADTSDQTAVDYYSMCREVCEAVMTNEIVNRPLGGPG